MKVVISLEVAGFATFKSGFEQGRAYREEAGITESDAYRNMDSPNHAWGIGTATWSLARRWLGFTPNRSGEHPLMAW